MQLEREFWMFFDTRKEKKKQIIDKHFHFPIHCEMCKMCLPWEEVESADADAFVQTLHRLHIIGGQIKVKECQILT